MQPSFPRTLRPVGVVLAAVLSGSFTLSSCGITSPDRAEEVEVVVDGRDLEDTVRVVTSGNFGFVVDEDTGQQSVQLLVADTVHVEPGEVPFEDTYPMAPSYRFLVRALVPDPEESEEDENEDELEQRGTLYLDVVLDGELVHSDSLPVGVFEETTGRLQYHIIER